MYKFKLIMWRHIKKKNIDLAVNCLCVSMGETWTWWCHMSDWPPVRLKRWTLTKDAYNCNLYNWGIVVYRILEMMSPTYRFLWSFPISSLHEATTCPAPFSLLAKGCYVIVSDAGNWRSWGMAHNFCQQYGGGLAQPYRLGPLQKYLSRRFCKLHKI